MANDRDADLIVADDAELAGRHGVAQELRARHLNPAELLAEEYRRQIGLRPWSIHVTRVHVAQEEYARVCGYRLDHAQGIGRTTRALLIAFATCTLEQCGLLMIAGSWHITRNVRQTALWINYRLATELHIDRRIEITDTRDEPRQHRAHYLYRDHADLGY